MREGSALPFVVFMPRLSAPYFCIGHRGAPALLPPGNTLASLQKAIEVGAQMLEVDVRRTADAVLVLSHDPEQPVQGQMVALRDHPYAWWQQATAETEVPIMTLSEVLDFAQQAQVGLMLDFKEAGMEEALIRAVSESGFPMDRVIVVGAGTQSRVLLRALNPDLILSLTLDHQAAGQITPGLIDALDTDAVTWHYTLLTPEIVTALHQKGLLVYPWTVDTPEEMRRLYEECHVDGIITNAPHLLQALFP